MTATTTLTIRVSAELRDKLARLAQDTRRSKSFLAAEAVSAYVDSELQIIEGVRRGIRDVEAGRVVPHDEAMAEIHGSRQSKTTGVEKTVARLPYIIAYAVTKEAGREVVSILRVIHTSRDWSDEKWPA